VAVTGRVIRFDELRGFGFVAPEQGGEDVFVHVNDVNFEKELIVPGALVEFRVEKGDRGSKATNVRLLEEGSAQDAPPARQASPRPAAKKDFGPAEVLHADDFFYEVTEAMLEVAPGMTAEQIVAVRLRLADVAHNHGWLED
jgi:cold shock CspA family protein